MPVSGRPRIHPTGLAGHPKPPVHMGGDPDGLFRRNVPTVRAAVRGHTPAGGLGVRPPAHVLAAADLGCMARIGSSRLCPQPRRFFGSVRGHSPGLWLTLDFHPSAAAAPHSPAPGCLGPPQVDSVHRRGPQSSGAVVSQPPPASHLGALRDGSGYAGGATTF